MRNTGYIINLVEYKNKKTHLAIYHINQTIINVIIVWVVDFRKVMNLIRSDDII